MSTLPLIQLPPESRGCSRERKRTPNIRASRASRPTTSDRQEGHVLTQVEKQRETTPELMTFTPEEEDLSVRREKLDLEGIKRELYRRECKRLKVTPIGSVVRNPTVSQLDLRHYAMGPEGAKALAVPLMVDSSLTHLDLEGNCIGPHGLAALVETLTDNCTLVHLSLANNLLGSRGANLAAKLLLKNKYISSIDLSENGFKDADSAAFGLIIRECRHLKSLILSRNQLGNRTGMEFKDALATNDTLEHLDVSWNHISNAAAAQLFNGVKENVGLHRFNFSFNGCGQLGIMAAGLALTSNSTLKELDLSSNRICNEDMAFLTGFKSNESLQILRLGNNLLTDKGTLILITAIEKAENCVLEELDLGKTSVNTNFLPIVEIIQERRPFKVTHGRVIVVPEPVKPSEDENNTGTGEK